MANWMAGNSGFPHHYFHFTVGVTETTNDEVFFFKRTIQDQDAFCVSQQAY